MTHGTTPSEPSPTDLDLFERWVTCRDEAAAAALWLRHQRLASAVATQIVQPLPESTEEA